MSKHKNLIAVLLIVVLSLALAACNAATPSAAGPAAQSGSTVSAGGITVVGQGTAYGQPDQATVVVGVDTFAETVGEATAQNQTTLDNVMAALAAAGIANEDIQTTNYSLYAEQVYGDNGPEGIAGYRVSNQVNVKIRDISLVGDVLGAVTEAGANAIYGVNFSVADPAALEAEARALAMQDAAERAASPARSPRPGACRSIGRTSSRGSYRSTTDRWSGPWSCWTGVPPSPSSPATARR